ncbi:hypothetical protein U1737_04850 [Sphingomonas sp. LB3N6]|uniref:hypothetical protein n=1 Tax=Sphingomonas fucosidasi TaxID=3096164 RepID=UPI002FC821C3
MSTNGTVRHTEPARGVWIGFDPADHVPGPLLLDHARAEEERRKLEVEEEALAAEAARTGIVIAISLPAGVVATWLFDFITGGPGLASMVGL